MHVTFSKQDIFHNLGGTVPEARSKDMEAPQVGTIALPTTTTIGGVEPSLQKPRMHPNDESSPAEPTTLPANINLPGSAEISPRGNIMMPSAKVNTDTPKDLATVRATSPAEAESWVVPATRLADKLTSPTTPFLRGRRGKQCVLTVTASVGRLNLEGTGVTSGDTMIV